MTNNKIRKALADLDDFIEKLQNVTNEDQGENWKASLKHVLIDYVGAQSTFVERLEDLDFTTQSLHETRWGERSYVQHIFNESNKASFRLLIETVKNHISRRGLYKVENNILSGFSNLKILSGFFTIMVVVAPAFLYLGSLAKDRELADVERQLGECRDQSVNGEKTTAKLQSEITNLKANLLKEKSKAIQFDTTHTAIK